VPLSRLSAVSPAHAMSVHRSQGSQFETVTVLLPPGAYWDVASPVKLFDSMAAGRPVVVTPRLETARVISEANAGLVAASDRAEDVAAAMAAVLADPERAAEMGAAGRRCAETTYDWRVLSSRLADAVLGPT
jgi:glycosyltransferase involved in cell wall biosynthesis